MKSKRTKATDISDSIRQKVYLRDKKSCIFCGSTNNIQVMHYISRGAGGLGIEENLACGCFKHHHELDQGLNRKEYRKKFKEYLEKHYPGFPDENRRYQR